MEEKIIKKKLRLGGLTCSACELRIENELKKLDGVYEVEVSYKTSILSITYDKNKISLDDIMEAIERIDYKVLLGTDELAVQENQKESNSQLIMIGIIIVGIFIIIKNTIGFNFIPQIDPGMGYGILFAVGVLTSLHCVAMCGGINLSVCVSYKFKEEDNGKYAKLIPSLMYNAGRVISYTIIGGIVGALGSVFSLSNKGSAFITIFAGAFMVIMGINMLNIFPWLRRLNPRMPKAFAKKINSGKRNKGPFIVGLLNGLMPCGPLQAMQLYALGTGSFLVGALSMFVFSLGTVPLLFIFGALGSMLNAKFTKNMMKVSAMLVIILGIVMLNRGVAFTGFTYDSFVTSKDSEVKNAAVVKGDVQEITTYLESGSYTPITVEAGTPVKWTIVAEKKDLNGCNNEIIIPKYNIQQKLVQGDNVITFTPKETGKFGYSCWMGMIRSSIAVVDDLKNADDVQNTEDSTEIDNSGMPSGCCGY